MADTAAVQFLLENLGQLALHHYKLISSASVEVEQLKNDLEYFNSFLVYASKKKIKDNRVRAFVNQIRVAVYDAEDVIDAFVTQASAAKAKDWLRRLFSSTISLDDIAQKVQKVREEVKGVYGDKNKIDLALLEIGDDGSEKLEEPKVREEKVVGFKDEAEKLIGYLKENTERLDIISIVGMPGLGKSTLSGKIFRDPEIQYEFPTRLWVYVSKFTPKDVFLSILREFTTITEDMRNMSEKELAKKVSDYLERGKFLIVMDDVWTPEDWKKVSVALPTTNHMGKILITTRYTNVAVAANSLRKPHDLRPFTTAESWELLQYEVFGEPKCESEVEDYGKIIAHKCAGLPLSVVVIGGILKEKLSATAKQSKRNVWEKFSERVNEYIVEDPAGTMKKIISFSYDKLPYHLRACFLYLGMFPEDIDISAWKLFRMWIAEGFIKKVINVSLEETAESYLDDLISRNLVRVDKRSSDGKVKTCRIHDSLREFCKNEAGKDGENFLQEIKKSDDGSLEPPIKNDKNYRRLCIHSNISKFVSSKPSGSRVRSFVCFAKEDITLQADHVAAIPSGFKLLRVLDVKPIKFAKIPSDMYDLLHLRYIHLSFNLSILPPAFSKLWNVQTLIVDTTERFLTIKADIWKMRHLRHLKTNVTATLPEPSKVDTDSENNIQTLGTISPINCTKKVFDRACNMKRVSIRGKIATLLNGSFDNMRNLGKLEKLKLQNDVFPEPPSEGKLPYLPPSEKFPPKLRILTLSDTFLDWGQMKVLASLDNLEVLKLKEKAFMGNYWETVDGGFRHLKVLFIGRTDLVVWKMSVSHFPMLMHLELQNCDDLREVPIEFAGKPYLSTLILNHCRTAAVSATEIYKKKVVISPEFRMSIFPPISLGSN